jgi:hypothetical protein
MALLITFVMVAPPGRAKFIFARELAMLSGARARILESST